VSGKLRIDKSLVVYILKICIK